MGAVKVPFESRLWKEYSVSCKMSSIFHLNRVYHALVNTISLIVHFAPVICHHVAGSKLQQ